MRSWSEATWLGIFDFVGLLFLLVSGLSAELVGVAFEAGRSCDHHQPAAMPIRVHRVKKSSLIMGSVCRCRTNSVVL